MREKGKTLPHSGLRKSGASVIRLRRDGVMVDVQPEDYLQLGDELMILAPVAFFTDTVSMFEAFHRTSSVALIGLPMLGSSGTGTLRHHGAVRR